MQSIDLMTRAMPILAAVVSRGADVVQGAAAAMLGDLAAGWLRGHGHSRAWDDYSSNPQNDSLVRHLLAEAVRQDADFQTRFEEAVIAAIAERPQNSGKQTISVVGTGDAQIGNRGDTITGGRVASRGSVYNETHSRTQNTRVSNKKSSPGVFIVVAIVLLLLIGLLVKGVGALIKHAASGGLAASSTCQQFLNADDQTEQQALVDIAASKGIGGFGSPLALPEIRYECSYEPTTTLGKLIERDRNEFG